MLWLWNSQHLKKINKIILPEKRLATTTKTVIILKRLRRHVCSSDDGVFTFYIYDFAFFLVYSNKTKKTVVTYYYK